MIEYKYADRRIYTITSDNISKRIEGQTSLDENDKSLDSNNHPIVSMSRVHYDKDQ